MARDRFQRYVDELSDADALVLHRIVCRRAASIYGPMYADRQRANYDAVRPQLEAFNKARRAISA